MDGAAAPRAQADGARVIGAYTWAVGAATLLVAALVLALGPPSALASAIIMVGVVALVGLPHGAYDLEVARRLLAHRVGPSWWVLFGGAYLALAAIGLGVWLALPWLGLALLLVGGAIHWGLDDLECRALGTARRAWLALSRGALPVAGPMLFHPGAVAEIFTALLGGSTIDAPTVRTIGAVWLFAACPGIVASVVWTSAVTPLARLRVAAEPVVLGVWFYAAPPILAFTVYFCFWHAVRHSLRSATGAMPGATLRTALIRYARASALPTALTWALAVALAFAWFGFDDTVRISWSLVFIGLFALTVPHVTLEWWESRSRVAPV